MIRHALSAEGQLQRLTCVTGVTVIATRVGTSMKGFLDGMRHLNGLPRCLARNVSGKTLEAEKF